MGWMEFTSDMTKALAWPIGAVLVALVFRGHIKSLFDRDKGSLTVGPLGVAWEGIRDVLTSELPEGTPAPEPRPGMVFASETAEELRPLIAVSPGAAILDGFLRVERALQELVGDKAPPTALTRKKVQDALELKLITEATARAIEGLRVMRNLAVHPSATSQEFTPERAVEYLVLVDAVLYAMRNKS